MKLIIIFLIFLSSCYSPKKADNIAPTIDINSKINPSFRGLRKSIISYMQKGISKNLYSKKELTDKIVPMINKLFDSQNKNKLPYSKEVFSLLKKLYVSHAITEKEFDYLKNSLNYITK